VRQLDPGLAALRVDEADDPRQHRDVLVLPDAEVLRADAPFGRDGRGLGKDQRRAADGAAAEVDQVPVVREPVVAGVLAHRGHEDAAPEIDAAQHERIEQGRHARCPSGGKARRRPAGTSRYAWRNDVAATRAGRMHAPRVTSRGERCR
jgi:hypothetical protein